LVGDELVVEELTHMWHGCRGSCALLSLLCHQLIHWGKLADGPVHLIHVIECAIWRRRGNMTPVNHMRGITSFIGAEE